MTAKLDLRIHTHTQIHILIIYSINNLIISIQNTQEKFFKLSFLKDADEDEPVMTEFKEL